jgi:hypothetical protein
VLGQAPAQLLDFPELSQPDVILGRGQIVGVNLLKGDQRLGINQDIGLLEERDLTEAFRQFLGAVPGKLNNVHIF